MINLFHYATGPIEKFKEGLVPRGSIIGSERKGLQHEFPWIKDKYTFAFLNSAIPVEWISNFSGEYWQQIRTHTGDLLISFEVLDSDEISVVDFAQLLKSKFPRNDREIKGYLQSRVPLSKYKDGYELPECIIANTIPESRISFSGDSTRGPKYKMPVQIKSLDDTVNYILHNSGENLILPLKSISSTF
jgi:hypothetical protein